MVLAQVVRVNADFLLEDLALSSAAQSGGDTAKEEVSDAGYSGLTKKEKDSVCSNVYSELPAPVAASLEPDSPTKELDSILDDLMGLAEGGSAYSTTPPPLTQKRSVKKTTEDGQQNSNGAAGSDSKAVTTNKKTDLIDDLLGGLSFDLEKIGIRTTAKGHCASCNKGLVGKIITALGQMWHPEHFVCAACKTELSTGSFFERDGQPYCEKDYHHLFSPRCAYCKGPIVQNIVTALDQTWHPEHFFCTHCGGLFGDEGFLEKEGKPYCPNDFYHLFAPKCSGCGEPVKESYLTAANGTWHSECFVCADCLQPFVDGCFMEMDGRPLCSIHFHTRRGTLCSGCYKPITGRCIAAFDRKFHPEHFVCAFCLRQLNQGIFKEQSGKPYCTICFNKLFV